MRRFVDRNENATDPLLAGGIGLGMATMNVPAGMLGLMSMATANAAREFREELERRERFKQGQSGSRSESN